MILINLQFPAITAPERHFRGNLTICFSLVLPAQVVGDWHGLPTLLSSPSAQAEALAGFQQ